MKFRSDKNHRIGFFGQVNEAIKEKLRYLEPKGASKRLIYALPYSVEKAYQEINSLQESYNMEREKLRLGLNSPIKTVASSDLLVKMSLSSVKTKILNDSKIRNSRIRLMRKDHSEKPLNRSKNLEKIDDIIVKCRELSSSNKNIPKNTIKTQDSLSKSFKVIRTVIKKSNLSPIRNNPVPTNNH